MYCVLQPIGMQKGKYEWAGNREQGDCSLYIRSAFPDFDEGEWECQVTSSDFTTQDSLSSHPAKLVVRGKWSYFLIAQPRMKVNMSSGDSVEAEKLK